MECRDDLQASCRLGRRPSATSTTSTKAEWQPLSIRTRSSNGASSCTFNAHLDASRTRAGRYPPREDRGQSIDTLGSELVICSRIECPYHVGFTSSGTIRTQQANTFKVYADEPQQEAPDLVKRKKSRLALDLGWALGDRTNGQPKEKDSGTPASATAPRSSTPTLSTNGSIGRLTVALKSKTSSSMLSLDSAEESGKENAGPKDKETWKWSIGIERGRKDATIKDVPGKRSKCKLFVG